MFASSDNPAITLLAMTAFLDGVLDRFVAEAVKAVGEAVCVKVVDGVGLRRRRWHSQAVIHCWPGYQS
jgi:predicted membrane protein